MADLHLAPILYRMRNRNRFCSADDILESVRRNVECLLNSRLSIPADYVLRQPDGASLKRLNNSLVNFGIVDFQSLNMGDPQMEKRFCDSVRRAIERFEPRLGKIQVEMISSKSDRVISTQVRAEMTVQPFEEIRFDTGLDTQSKSFVVT